MGLHSYCKVLRTSQGLCWIVVKCGRGVSRSLRQVVTLGIAKLSQCVSLVRVDWRREDDGESGFRREQKVG